VTHRRVDRPGTNGRGRILIRGARCTFGPQDSAFVSIEVSGKFIERIDSDPTLPRVATSNCMEIDLSGLLILPGLINAHDHLEFALFPRLANPPYQNYIEWGVDIHNTFADAISRHRRVGKELRVWWGGIRNLLCGATTVSHHNPFRSEFARVDFPVRVIHEYGWGHSLALGGDLLAARVATPEGYPFILHACEGIDDQARSELGNLDRAGLLDASTVLVHGLAMDRDEAALMRKRGASLIVCPSSNHFLFGRVPDLSVLGDIEHLSLGNDSPLTAEGDLLDEIRFTMQACGISPQNAYKMVTEAPAAILRLKHSEGAIKVSGIADLIAARDTGGVPAQRLATLSMEDIEFVMLGGQVQLASSLILERLPIQIVQDLEPLSIDGAIRWLRAPVRDMLERTERVLGAGQVRLGSRRLSVPSSPEKLDISQEKRRLFAVEAI
jgi:hypothetical protein